MGCKVFSLFTSKNRRTVSLASREEQTEVVQRLKTRQTVSVAPGKLSGLKTLVANLVGLFLVAGMTEAVVLNVAQAETGAEIFLTDDVGLFERWHIEKNLVERHVKKGQRGDFYREMNLRDVEALKSYIPQKNSPRSTLAPSISAEEADEFLEFAQWHPQSSPYIVAHWDPEGQIGFCFGRAMAVDLEARFRGLDRNAIAKAWVVGQMKLGTSEWAWHVTTILYSHELGWVAIDPIYDEVISIEEWYEDMQAANRKAGHDDLRIYFTQSQRFGPSARGEWDSLGRYVNRQIKDDFYNGFFEALLEVSRKASNLATRIQNIYNNRSSELLEEGIRLEDLRYFIRKEGELRPSSLQFLEFDPEYSQEVYALMSEVLREMQEEGGILYE